MQSIDISGFNSGAQKKNKKPFLLVDDAFQELQNAYVWREEVKKREGLQFIGRLRRQFLNLSLGNSGASPWTVNLFTAATIDLTTEPNAQIEPGSVEVTINPTTVTGNITAPGYTNASDCQVFSTAHGLSTGNIISISGVVVVSGDNRINGGPYTIEVIDANSFKIGVDSHTWGVWQSGGIWSLVIGGQQLFDQGNGLLATNPVSGVTGFINYLTGNVVITGGSVGNPTIANFNYFPSLPGMGIPTRELSGVNDEQTLWFDQKYCYIFTGIGFQEFIAGNTWDGEDFNFFWGTNYRGIVASLRLFFETNFVNDVGSPMRYTDGATWTTFQPLVAGPPLNPNTFLFTARILIPYYGRLLALNTYEGTAQVTAQNFFSRCRFSQIGDPTQVDAWRTDIFGKGGFVDAPTNESIISATFYKNTLIVQFERSTWRLQYVGEYGIPFIWQRISSDFGSGSTFSPVLFDSGVLAVADKGIVASSGGDVKRIDMDIPDLVYDFINDDNGPYRVQGIRDFRKEVVYWCYPDFNTLYDNQFFPNYTLLYNYRNNTYAFFRNNITCFGNFQYDANISWDRFDIFWDNYQVTWDSVGQSNSPLIVSLNQQGFAHFYGYPDVETIMDSHIDAIDQESLAVSNVTIVPNVSVILTIINHNLQNDEIIYLTGLNYVITTSPASAGSTTLNDTIYMVEFIDVNNIQILAWDQPTKEFAENFSVTTTGTYVGGGVIALFPRVYAETKDFNPAKQIGQNFLSNSIDFLFDATSPASMNIQLKMNTTLAAQANVVVGNQNIEQSNSKNGYIQNITLSNPCVVTSAQHGLLTGDEIAPLQVGGTVQLNSNEYIVTFIDINTFSINVDSTGFTAYTTGGYWTQTKQQYYTLSAKYAWHRFFANAYGQYMSVVITNNNEQMAQLSTHQQNFVLNAMRISYRPAGTNIFGK